MLAKLDTDMNKIGNQLTAIDFKFDLTHRARDAFKVLQTKLNNKNFTLLELEEISVSASKCVETVQLVTGFLSFKCLRLTKDDKAALTELEREGLKKMEDNLESLVSKVLEF